MSGVIDTIESTETKTLAKLMEEISKGVTQKAVENGAKSETVQVVEINHLPLQVVPCENIAIKAYRNV